MNQVLRVPAFAGSRAGAREFVAPLAGVVRDQRVRLEFGRTKAVAPSFMDEVVRALLVEQQAGHLELHDASERAVELALRFAANHKVADRLTVASLRPVA